jgi:aspartyl/glutamyl-tRNA(Asn/Gln) amidotransferase C subunit
MNENSKIDVRALAALSRVEVTDEEVVRLEKELLEIVAFIETIQKADVSQARSDTSLRNVMRDDANPHESGIYTDELLAGAPRRLGNRIAVNQVVSRKK